MYINTTKTLFSNHLKRLTGVFKFSLTIFILIPFVVSAEQSKGSISGFARLVGGYLDEDAASYQGYENTFSISPDSLIGVKGEYRFNENWAVVAQGIFTESDTRKTGLDWLYVSYKPTFDWQIDLGKFRTPFFDFSETIDVGFAYPWVIPPQSTYSNALFSSVEGTRATYLFNVDDLNFTLSAFGGGFDGSILEGNSSVGSKADLLTGANLRLNSGNFKSRIGFVTGDFKFDVNELSQLQAILMNFDFNQTASDIELDGKISFYQASAGYETFDYFILSEASVIDSESDLIAKIKNIYLTAGLFDDAVTYYATIAALRTSNESINNGVPKGLSPQLDVLAFGVDNVISGRIEDDIDMATLGMRWDVRPNVAFKTEISLLNGKDNQRSTFSEINDEDFDRQSTFYLFSIDWLF